MSTDQRPDLDAPTTATLHTFIDWELVHARQELVEARDKQQARDTPEHREAVDACNHRLDVLLDMHSDIQRGIHPPQQQGESPSP